VDSFSNLFSYRKLINLLTASCLLQKLNFCQDLMVYVMNYCKRMGMFLFL
jgi:hypothetical protein